MSRKTPNTPSQESLTTAPRIRINPQRDHIVTAWGERVRESTSNDPVWVLIRDSMTGEYRVECLQPDEQSESLRRLHSISSTVSETMRVEVVKMAAVGKF